VTGGFEGKNIVNLENEYVVGCLTHSQEELRSVEII
jgi:hypothetical protein